jgi:hypothetical protein
MMSPTSESREAVCLPVAQGTTGPDWERFCKELLAEREQMRASLEKAVRDRDLYRKALQSLLPVEEVPFTKEEVFAQRGRKPSLHELIDELQRQASA